MLKRIKLLLVVYLLTLTITCAQKIMKLDFDPSSYQTKTLTLNEKTFKVRAYEKIIYVEKPVDTAYQVMNIYIPEEYFNGKSIGTYTAENAPIFFPNQIGGYMPAKPASTEMQVMGMRPPSNGQEQQIRLGHQRPPESTGPRRNTVLEALSRGYVVASAGARGRTNDDGKAPAGIVDLKAAIRYLKFNDKKMPGDAGKIISNGTSAGGAMSALLGVTGNHPDYEMYLKALGAANAKDNIFAVSSYCPITNLDHADIAYEWQFYGINSYKRRDPFANDQSPQNLSAEQIAMSKDLKEAFPIYLNSLHLKDKQGKILTLDENGDGNFKELVKSYVVASAQIALNSGKDLSAHQWITIKGGRVIDLDWNNYIVYMERQKTPPAFDALDESTGENQLFGTATSDKLHFTKYGQLHSSIAGSTIADQKIIKMMNPMYYITDPKTQPAAHWRIRHGSKDKDTGLAISVMLSTLLENKGYDVNLELPWDVPHSGDYDLNKLFEWMDSIVQRKAK